MLDVAVAYNRYKFLGYEFLTWLWFMIEKEPDKLKDEKGQPVSLRVGNRIVLENSRREYPETIIIKGSESELEEGRLAVRKGAVVTEMNISLFFDNRLWTCDIKGESLDLSGLKTPPVETDKNHDGSTPVVSSENMAATVSDNSAGGRQNKATGADLETDMLVKMELYEVLVAYVQHTYQQFIRQRITPAWQDKTVSRIRKWIVSAPGD